MYLLSFWNGRSSKNNRAFLIAGNIIAQKMHYCNQVLVYLPCTKFRMQLVALRKSYCRVKTMLILHTGILTSSSITLMVHHSILFLLKLKEFDGVKCLTTSWISIFSNLFTNNFSPSFKISQILPGAGLNVAAGLCRPLF